MNLENINDAWSNFIETDNVDFHVNNMNNTEHSFDFEKTVENNVSKKHSDKAPKCSDLYISTKTKIIHLNQSINLSTLFWDIPVIPYHSMNIGIIKKQMKINSTRKEDLEEIKDKLKHETRYYTEHVISHIENPDGRIKFKDIRKINIGLSRKDIESYRARIKGAFYNCFVLLLRIKHDNKFKELHVKIFNTGKMEIPGIQNNEVLFKTLDLLIEILQPLFEKEIYYKKDSIETALYNSNFKCGYYINREKLYNILKYNYNIHAIFDPCSYPGVQSKFYYKKGSDNIEEMTGNKTESTNGNISFMIFRTGSVLIVGKCEKRILYHVYNFIKNILEVNYEEIYRESCDLVASKNNITKRKIKKKIVIY